MRKFSGLFSIIVLVLAAVVAPAQKYTEFSVNVKSGQAWQVPVGTNRRDEIAVNFYVGEQKETDVYLVDAENLQRFNKGESFASLYTAKQTKSGIISLKLPRGIYHLLINNREYWYDKSVKLQIFQ